MYAMGTTQHTVGTQNVRAYAILQLLLGNIGLAGGGINALRGESNVQGSTDAGLLWHILTGYNPCPEAKKHPNYEAYIKAVVPKTNDPMSINWWSNRPKYIVSMLKAWFGDAATKENDFCFDWLPKAAKGTPHIVLFEDMYKGMLKGGFFFGTNPVVGGPNSNKEAKALEKARLARGHRPLGDRLLHFLEEKGGRPEKHQDRSVPAAGRIIGRERGKRVQLGKMGPVEIQGPECPGSRQIRHGHH